MIVRINCFVKEIAFTKHVQLWTRHDIECSNMFLLYDLIVIWLFIHECKTSIASRCSHDYSNQLFYQKKLHLQNVCTRHDIRLFSNRLYYQENCIVVLLIFRYVFVARFVRIIIVCDYSWLDHFFVIIFLSMSIYFRFWIFCYFDFFVFLFVLLFLNHAHLTVSRIFSRIFANLIYFWKISTKFWTMIFSLNYTCFTNRQIFH